MFHQNCSGFESMWRKLVDSNLLSHSEMLVSLMYHRFRNEPRSQNATEDTVFHHAIMTPWFIVENFI